MLKQKNTKKQGDVGLGAAIAWATAQGYTVSVPLTESQDYDLIVDDGQKLLRVEVKTSNYARRGRYQVTVCTRGGNRSGEGKTKPLSKERADLLFVLVGDGKRYVIPIEKLRGSRIISLCAHYDEYIAE